MNTDAIIKIVLGVALLLVFWPAGYLALPPVLNWILIIVAAIIGIKLILDGINRL